MGYATWHLPVFGWFDQSFSDTFNQPGMLVAHKK
jgi:hypothetical protein